MLGTVTKLFISKGYGFIRGSDGLSRFAHCRDWTEPLGFETTAEGMAVEFEPEFRGGKGNGLVATKIAKAVRL